MKYVKGDLYGFNDHREDYKKDDKDYHRDGNRNLSRPAYIIEISVISLSITSIYIAPPCTDAFFFCPYQPPM